MQAVWEDETVCRGQALLEFSDMNICVIYSSLQYFHNHTHDGERPPENSGYAGIVGRIAGFGQMDVNVFDSLVRRA